MSIFYTSEITANQENILVGFLIANIQEEPCKQSEEHIKARTATRKLTIEEKRKNQPNVLEKAYRKKII